MLRRRHSAPPVGRPHRHHAGRRFEDRVDHHERDAVLVEPGVLGRGELGEVEQHARRAARGELVQPAALRALAPGPGQRRRDHHLQARVVRRPLHAVQHRARPGALQRVHHEVDQPRRLGRLEAGSADVTEPVERLGDPATRLRCHVLPAVDHLRRGRHGDPRLAGDDRQRRPGHASRTDHESPPPRPARGPSKVSTSTARATETRPA